MKKDKWVPLWEKPFDYGNSEVVERLDPNRTQIPKEEMISFDELVKKEISLERNILNLPWGIASAEEVLTTEPKKEPAEQSHVYKLALRLLRYYCAGIHNPNYIAPIDIEKQIRTRVLPKELALDLLKNSERIRKILGEDLTELILRETCNNSPYIASLGVNTPRMHPTITYDDL